MAYIAWDRLGWDGERHGQATVDFSQILLFFFFFCLSFPIPSGIWGDWSFNFTVS